VEKRLQNRPGHLHRALSSTFHSLPVPDWTISTNQG
jgi:hypothetical protein